MHSVLLLQRHSCVSYVLLKVKLPAGNRIPQVQMCFSLFVFHRHFLFKQGTGSAALLSGAGQGYPLTSGTVYSPPPRPLPRSSVTRPLFTFNKPHRCCNWKCTALSASLLTLTLALLLTYVIGELENLGHVLIPKTRCLCFDFSSTIKTDHWRSRGKVGCLSGAV